MERISVDDGGAQFFFLCECKKQYEDIRMFQSHVTKSGHCGGTFNTKVLERHKRLKAEEFEFVCECSKRFSHEREFESHVTRFSHCGGLFNRTVRERYRRPVFKNATFPNQDCSCTNDEEFSYTCECSQVFYDWKLFRNHVTKTRHCGGLFNSEVLGRCRKLKVTKATPFTQTSKQPIGVDYEFVCTCSERFADQVRLERHIKKSGHFEGMFDYDVYNYCRKPVGHLAVRKHDNVIEDSTTRTLPARSSAPINPTANIKVDGAARPSTMQKLSDFISGSEVIRVSGGNVMADGEHMLEFKECSLIGTLIESSKMKRKRNEDVSSRGFEDQKSDQQRVFLNTHEPFCLVTVGVQGGGKSHTLATVLEGCLIPFPENSLCRLEEPMTTLVLHFDDCPYIRCEATELISAAPQLREILGDKAAGRCVGRERMTILVSPSYYRQRKEFYRGLDCDVRPLLLEWRTLSANQIKCLMGIKDADSQLDVFTVLNILKRYQREDKIPPAHEFFQEVRAACGGKSQEGPLGQRLALLETLIAESDINRSIRGSGGDLYWLCTSGRFVIADMTDPLLSKSDVNGLFQVLVEQYRTLPLGPGSGRLLALNEAHKYMDGVVNDGLSGAIVNIARSMRQDRIHLVVGTQSPLALAPELLELVTVAVIHRFHSKDWFNYLKVKIPLENAAWGRLLDLNPGEALVFASRHQIGASDKREDGGTAERKDSYKSDTCPLCSDNKPFPFGRNVFGIKIRARITADVGSNTVDKQKKVIPHYRM